MEFLEKIKALAVRVEKQKDSILTEEACKNAFVMPFLNALGYEVFNPEIVVPEFTADFGVKKGEKVDYAIKLNGVITMLVECKPCGSDLAQQHTSQLYRYFSVTDARFYHPNQWVELLVFLRPRREEQDGSETVL